MRIETFDAYANQVREFIRTAGSSPDAAAPVLEERFNAFALALFELQFEHVPVYARFCRNRGATPGTVHSWEAIPAIPSAAFKEFDLTSLSPQERAAVFHSSGTTAQAPGKQFHNEQSLAVYEASLAPWFQAHLLPDLDVVGGNMDLLILTPPPRQAPHSSLVHMMETVRRQFGSHRSSYLGKTGSGGAWELDISTVRSQIERAAAASTPAALLGTAFSFVHLLDFLEDRGLVFPLPAGSRVMETGGYKGRSRTLPKPELHRWITQQLGIPPDHIVCEYGMSELSSQSYDRVAGALLPGEKEEFAEPAFQFPPWARAKIISPESGQNAAPGETGLIQVIDLANIRSVLALQTEDLAIRRPHGFALAGRIPQAEARGCSLMNF